MMMEMQFSKVSLKSRSLNTRILPITKKDSRAEKLLSRTAQEGQLIRLMKAKISSIVRYSMRDLSSTIP